MIEVEDIYFSQWLSTMYPPGTMPYGGVGLEPPPDVWNGARPGTFTVSYAYPDNQSPWFGMAIVPGVLAEHQPIDRS